MNIERVKESEVRSITIDGQFITKAPEYITFEQEGTYRKMTKDGYETPEEAQEEANDYVAMGTSALVRHYGGKFYAYLEVDPPGVE